MKLKISPWEFEKKNYKNNVIYILEVTNFCNGRRLFNLTLNYHHTSISGRRYRYWRAELLDCPQIVQPRIHMAETLRKLAYDIRGYILGTNNTSYNIHQLDSTEDLEKLKMMWELER